MDNFNYMNLCFRDNSDSSITTRASIGHIESTSSLSEESKGVLSEKVQQTEEKVEPTEEKIQPTEEQVEQTEDKVHQMERKVQQTEAQAESEVQENAVVKTDDWAKIVQPRKGNFDKLMMGMVAKSIKPSVQIYIGHVSFNCHLLVLQCYSKFFRSFTNELFITLPERRVSANAFSLIYEWMLAKKPQIQRNGIMDLFSAASFLGITALINQCWACIDHAICFHEDKAFELYLEARIYELDIVKELMIKRIRKYFLTLVSSQEFLDLSEDELCAILSLNTIGVNSEIEVFLAVVRWLTEDWDERQPSMLILIASVRFGLMPSWFLLMLARKPGCCRIARVVAHPEVVKLIDDAMCLATTRECYGDNKAQYNALINQFDMVIPTQRLWVFDNVCSYHFRADCPRVHHVSYSSFLEYLEMISTLDKDHWKTLKRIEDIDANVQCCCIGSKSTEFKGELRA